MKFIIKKPGEDLEVLELEKDKDNFSTAWNIDTKFKDLCEDTYLDSVGIGGNIVIIAGDNSALDEKPANFVILNEEEIPELAHQVAHGSIVFAKRKYVEDYGRSFEGLTEAEIIAIKNAFKIIKAEDELGNVLPVFHVGWFQKEL